MTEGDYNKAMEMLKECEKHLTHGDYDFAHICVIEALVLLDQREDNPYEIQR